MSHCVVPCGLHYHPAFSGKPAFLINYLLQRRIWQRRLRYARSVFSVG
jgi:hypothetical protein